MSTIIAALTLLSSLTTPLTPAPRLTGYGYQSTCSTDTECYDECLSHGFTPAACEAGLMPTR